MRSLSPKIIFDSDYLRLLAIKEAEKLPQFKGVELSSRLEFDGDGYITGNIIVEEIIEESEK